MLYQCKCSHAVEIGANVLWIKILTSCTKIDQYFQYQLINNTFTTMHVHVFTTSERKKHTDVEICLTLSHGIWAVNHLPFSGKECRHRLQGRQDSSCWLGDLSRSSQNKISRFVLPCTSELIAHTNKCVCYTNPLSVWLYVHTWFNVRKHTTQQTTDPLPSNLLQLTATQTAVLSAKEGPGWWNQSNSALRKTLNFLWSCILFHTTQAIHHTADLILHYNKYFSVC